MKKYIILYLLVFVCRMYSAGLTYNFSPGSLTGEDSTYFQFAIKVKASEAGTYLGDTQIYLNYNTSIFGEYVAENNRVEVSKSWLISAKPGYGEPIVKDNGPGCLAITILYNTPGDQAGAGEVPIWFDYLVVVKMTIVNRVGSVGLRFNEALMEDQQYLYNNATKYNPIDATHTNGTFVTDASTVLLQPGPESAWDNFMEVLSSWTGSMDEKNGWSSQVKVGNIKAYTNYYRRNRTLMKFDVSGIDSGSYVNEVEFRLRLRANECDNSYQNLDIHKVLVPWNEMTSCWNRPETGAADWAGCAPNNVWASCTISASINRNGNFSGWCEWTSTGLRDMVQYWVDHPNENYGFLIKLRSDDQNADHLFRFHSSDVTDPTIRPVMEITFQAGE